MPSGLAQRNAAATASSRPEQSVTPAKPVVAGAVPAGVVPAAVVPAAGGTKASMAARMRGPLSGRVKT